MAVSVLFLGLVVDGFEDVDEYFDVEAELIELWVVGVDLCEFVLFGRICVHVCEYLIGFVGFLPFLFEHADLPADSAGAFPDHLHVFVGLFYLGEIGVVVSMLVREGQCGVYPGNFLCLVEGFVIGGVGWDGRCFIAVALYLSAAVLLHGGQ
jgi:hypothetical protein